MVDHLIKIWSNGSLKLLILGSRENHFMVELTSSMSEDPSEALVKANPEAAIHTAIEFWAEGSTRAETFERASKLRDKTQAVKGFFAFAGKHPGEVMPEDVRAWREHLESLGQKPATVYARVSRVSAFFKWLMSDPLLGQHIRSNPVAQARPRHPQPYQSESVKALTDDEMNRLLEVVRAMADVGSVVAKRDYALLLFFFLTGLRRNEVILLRGKDLEQKDGSWSSGIGAKAESSSAGKLEMLASTKPSSSISRSLDAEMCLALSARCGRGMTVRGSPAHRSHLAHLPRT